MGPRDLKRSVLKYIVANENENPNYQSIWDPVKAVLRGRCIALNAYIIFKKSKINHLSFHLRELKKEVKTKSDEERK